MACVETRCKAGEEGDLRGREGEKITFAHDAWVGVPHLVPLANNELVLAPHFQKHGGLLFSFLLSTHVALSCVVQLGENIAIMEAWFFHRQERGT